MNGSLRAQCIAEFLGTGLFLFFGICCLSALKLTGASPVSYTHLTLPTIYSV